jgi:hypothetical protein
MTNNYFFADVDLPFHVWVKEGGRWVLREAPLSSAMLAADSAAAALLATSKAAPRTAERRRGR